MPIPVLIVLLLLVGAAASLVFSAIKYTMVKEYRTTSFWSLLFGAIVGGAVARQWYWVISGIILAFVGYIILDIIIGFIRDRRQGL